MTATPRGNSQGVLQIVRFNWPMYAGAAVVLAGGAALVLLIPLPHLLRLATLAGIALAAFWLFISLAVSHYVYDRAGVYRGDWLASALPHLPASYANLHAGFDESSLLLATRFPASEALVLDFFDEQTMTEPSLPRARRLATSQPSAQLVDYRSLPLHDGALDAAFLIFAAHELRESNSRVQLLRELHRSMRSVGRIVVMEHLRDVPNFLAFGPGFLHFHSRKQWVADFSAAQLQIAKEFPVTPFVRVFVLEKT